MKRGQSSGAGSLDMLLDTMCNTFGGVCFIALMVAIISASLPGGDGQEDAEPEVSEQMIVNRETARLVRERDELKSAIAIQRAFVATNSTGEARALSVARFAESIASNATAVAKLRRERLELEDKLAKLTTDVSYSTREALRLERLLKELEERLGRPGNMKSRPVRTPVERELAGYRSFDLWLRNGRLYCLRDESQVECNITDEAAGRQWKYRVRPGGGYAMGDSFWRSAEYRRVVDQVHGKMFFRIFSDSASFAQLCALRDDLIGRRKMYNWHVNDNDVLYFVEGYDGKVQ